MRKRIKTLTAFFAAIAVISLILFYLVGSRLAAPAYRKIGQPPKGLKAEDISIVSSGEKQIKGWLFRSDQKNGVIILMHGIRGNRTAMLGRAKFLFADGYSVLLFDFQAHGESDGEHITFGYLESQDTRAAVNFARKQYPSQPVGVIAQSLGGAACLIGESPIEADALILESVYPSIEEAVANRLEIYVGKIGRCFTPILTMQLQFRFDIDPDKLRPEHGIGKLRCPVFLINGSADRRTTLSETRRLYHAAPEPKELWIVQEARHVDLHRFGKVRYEKRVSAFLKKHFL